MTRIDAAVGSSPPSRGIYAPCRGGFPRRGTIPALVGNTESPSTPTPTNGDHPALAGNTHPARLGPAARADHPRSRGEYISTSLAEDYRAGSSPLSRGIPPRAGEHQPLLRIIPALVGNTPTNLAAPPSAQDHPRSRGEYYGLGFSTRSPEGSSPLSRGILPEPGAHLDQLGIIPALAGNTLPRHHRGGGERDHPRSRGEYAVSRPAGRKASGSSPLSRGIPSRRSRRIAEARIIPALAGNTSSPRPPAHGGTDHPRSRGEYWQAGSAKLHRTGSSPLSRGIHNGLGGFGIVDRIIPALAGNTRADAEAVRPGGDHPRSRGEYDDEAGDYIPHDGSSPLSRGIRPAPGRSRSGTGIIPALAGNTRRRAGRRSREPDHPRSRGEYRSVLSARHCDHGSSPLSRGILVLRVQGGAVPGIIPALAGNTVSEIVASIRQPDHPRSRGEYPHEPEPVLSDVGSSPLSRGIRPRRPGRGYGLGIIPALAGNTPPRRARTPAAGDHPRSRGEYERRNSPNGVRGGSSPLSRGIPHHPAMASPPTRIIPALAGNTGTNRFPTPPSRDHPRSRGEYVVTAFVSRQADGSSPLSRGIPASITCNTCRVRIIPALAGNTRTSSGRPPRRTDHPRSRGEYARDIADAVEDVGSSPLSRGIRG